MTAGVVLRFGRDAFMRCSTGSGFGRCLTIGAEAGFEGRRGVAGPGCSLCCQGKHKSVGGTFACCSERERRRKK